MKLSLGKPPPRPSELAVTPANELELALSHALGLVLVRAGYPSVPRIGEAFAAYRERLIKQIEHAKGKASPDELIASIRDGRLW